jgi:hypothetical protein
LDAGLHGFVHVGEVGIRVVPAFLEREVENYVTKLPLCEIVVIFVAAAEEYEFLGGWIILVGI